MVRDFTTQLWFSLLVNAKVRLWGEVTRCDERNLRSDGISENVLALEEGELMWVAGRSRRFVEEVDGRESEESMSSTYRGVCARRVLLEEAGRAGPE